MDELPGLDWLSHAEKNSLIRTLFAHVKSLTVQVAALTAKVGELEGLLAQNSRNSSKPPSTDGMFKPKPKSQCRTDIHPNGGQKGHSWHTLKSAAPPDHIETHRPASHCSACHHPLDGGRMVETRQVFDILPLRHEVTEHQVTGIRCHCGKIYRGEFPGGVTALVMPAKGKLLAIRGYCNLCHCAIIPNRVRWRQTGCTILRFIILSQTQANLRCHYPKETPPKIPGCDRGLEKCLPCLKMNFRFMPYTRRSIMKRKSSRSISAIFPTGNAGLRRSPAVCHRR